MVGEIFYGRTVAFKVWLQLSRIILAFGLTPARTIGFGTFAAFISDNHVRDSALGDLMSEYNIHTLTPTFRPVPIR